MQHAERVQAAVSDAKQPCHLPATFLRRYGVAGIAPPGPIPEHAYCRALAAPPSHRTHCAPFAAAGMPERGHPELGRARVRVLLVVCWGVCDNHGSPGEARAGAYRWRRGSALSAARTSRLPVRSQSRRLRPNSDPLYTKAPRSSRELVLLMLKRSRALDGTAMSTASGATLTACLMCAAQMQDTYVTRAWQRRACRDGRVRFA